MVIAAYGKAKIKKPIMAQFSEKLLSIQARYTEYAETSAPTPHKTLITRRVVTLLRNIPNSMPKEDKEKYKIEIGIITVQSFE